MFPETISTTGQASGAEFVGRADLLAAAAKISGDRPSSSIWDMQLLGPRGMGKTSALIKIRAAMPQDLMAVYIPCRSSGDDEFIEHILQEVERQLVSNYRKPISFIDQIASLRSGNRSASLILTEALASLESPGLFILLDDAHEAPIEALVLLKSAVNQLRLLQDRRTGLIIASENDCSARMLKAGLNRSESFLFSFELKPFNSDETKAILIHSFPIWADKSLQTVYSRTKGHPVMVQLYASAYAQRMKADEQVKIIVNATAQKPGQSYGVLDAVAKVTLDFTSQKIISECHNPVKEAALEWYKAGWRKQPSKAEWKAVLALAHLGGSARFESIKKLYGRNPAPQLNRAVQKGAIEHMGRGTYSLPHSIITEAIREKYLQKAAKKI